MLTRSFIRAFLDRSIHRRTFNNRKFWDDRYSNDPDKGSGPGSRGEFRALKNQLVRAILEEGKFATVLDIGCGDIAILDDIEIKEYVGVDISSVVIEKNRSMRPNWQFLCEDLTSQFIPEPADLVLCLDVLIHQRTFLNYQSILSKAVGAARHVALVSGYSERDPGWNVFFHEPIESSVRKLCPAAKTEKIAEYRGTHLLKVQINRG